MKVLFAGGGTAGHINPAVSIAKECKKRWPGCEIAFVGNPSGMEYKLVPKAGFPIFPLHIRGFHRKISLYNLGTARLLFSSLAEAGRILRKFRPDLVVGTGGYVSGPILYKAAKAGIPTAIHEQNSYPGVTTRILSRYVDKIMVTSEDSVKYLKNKQNAVLTGMPVSEEVLFYKKETARRELGLDEKPVVLSFGGSLGARKLNEAVCDFLELSLEEGRTRHIHATGARDHEWFLGRLREKGVDVRSPLLDIREYIYDMPRCIAAADLVVCRSGAGTLSELQVQGKPSILVPSPNVTANHQYHNAVSVEKRGAAVVIEDGALTGRLLYDAVNRLLGDRDKLESMGKAACRMAIFDTNERIFHVLSSITR